MTTTELLLRANEILKTFSLEQVPLMGFCTPSVVAISDESCTISIPLNQQTKNHLACMYFGALHIGADTAGGILAMHQIQKAGQNVSLIFKTAEAAFLRRAEGDVHFRCDDGIAITDAVKETVTTKERVNLPIKIVATVPSISSSEIVANFALTLSLKCID